MTIAGSLDSALRAVCPIIGVSIGRKDDKSTWRIDFDATATPDQRRAASVVVEKFDVLQAETEEAARLALLTNRQKMFNAVFIEATDDKFDEFLKPLKSDIT